MDAEASPNGSVIAAASLSVVSTLGFLGTCLMNHKDTIMEKAMGWISWSKKDDQDHPTDIEAPRPSTMMPNISFPIVINNNSGDQRPAQVTLSPSPFEERRPRPVTRHRRSYSDPTYESSSSGGESPLDDDSSHTADECRASNTSDSSDMVYRRVSLEK